MTTALKDRLGLAFGATFFGGGFVLSGGEEYMFPRLVGIGVLALAVLAWTPLHRRFTAWGILALYFFLMVGWLALVEPENGGGVGVFLLSVVMGVVFLLFCRQKPIEQRDSLVAWAVIHGLWDSLEKEGLPPDEIERLKRLTPEERAAMRSAVFGSGVSRESRDRRFPRHGVIDESSISDDTTGISIDSDFYLLARGRHDE